MKVIYDAATCVHAGNCVNSLPAVFKIVNGQFVIDQKGANETEIRQTVASCPSGALRITDNDTPKKGVRYRLELQVLND